MVATRWQAWCAPYLANMMPDRSEIGAVAARMVHAGLLSPDPGLNAGRSGSPSPVHPESGNLSTVLPFDADAVNLRVLGFAVDDSTFFAAKVIGGEWPDQRPLTVTYPEGLPELTTIPANSGGGRRVAIVRPRANKQVRAMGSAHETGRTLRVGAEAVAWLGLPELTITARPVRDLSEVGAVIRSTDPVPVVEVVTTPGRRWGVGRSAEVIRGPAPDQSIIFDRAAELLSDLERRGAIHNVGTVPAIVRPDRRGDHDVWQVETHREKEVSKLSDPWAFITPGEEHPRTILVLAAQVELFGYIRWFEVERRTTDGRETESYRAVIVAFAHPPAPEEVASLVSRLTRSRGRVRDLAAFVEGTAAAGAATFKHSSS